MRTKFILGLAAGIIAAGQVASAQNVSTGIASDKNFTEAVTAIDCPTNLDVGDGSFNSQAQSTSPARTDVISMAAMGWQSTEDGLNAVVSDGSSFFESAGWSESDFSTARVTEAPSLSKLAANHSPVHVDSITENLATPEPGTIGLLMVGIGALASRSVFRRKNKI
jgi:hypothetical protein